MPGEHQGSKDTWAVRGSKGAKTTAQSDWTNPRRNGFSVAIFFQKKIDLFSPTLGGCLTVRGCRHGADFEIRCWGVVWSGLAAGLEWEGMARHPIRQCKRISRHPLCPA